MTDLAFNIAGWGFTAVLAIYGGVILWLHTWMRTRENEPGNEDD